MGECYRVVCPTCYLLHSYVLQTCYKYWPWLQILIVLYTYLTLKPITPCEYFTQLVFINFQLYRFNFWSLLFNFRFSILLCLLDRTLDLVFFDSFLNLLFPLDINNLLLLQLNFLIQDPVYSSVDFTDRVVSFLLTKSSQCLYYYIKLIAHVH